MSKLIATAGLAALMAVSSLIIPASGASAAQNDLTVQVQWREDHRGWDRHPGRHGDRDRHGRRDVCSPGFAEAKASRMGLRRARVIEVNRRVVVVAGFDRHGRDRIVFANDRGCPVIRR
ncbi:hypothetical protein [Rhizobium sp. SSA_523]|uniref:hypothetical protein n=1 Tax=Rhizobium sp. SSA_523 TaxID=2952477 RepID=UPI00209164CF|nr:hypothetical protein [Rhizobium sp. SSA_523]MCO5730355.1 hypothetical protein [Rhizobium sp. SSA_523]WKC25402.1 hypothetical protein QTJ18_15655 [Rhizobium sp. SSA_523]